jgi:FAD/FMN-containing dehydrogenase
VLRAGGGVLLSEVVARSVPAGWFLPVTPGTKFVTLAGAIANDVHGKNHHRAGTIGRHVRRFALLRSDGSRRVCSREENGDLFRATVGGLGLTGVILWAEIQLSPIHSRLVEVETIRFGRLSDFFQLSSESDLSHEYTVAWIDCLAKGPSLGRGWFIRGNHARGAGSLDSPKRGRSKNVFFDPPFSLVNRYTLKAFNLLYYHRPVPKPGPTDFEPFFYPLDAVLNWNRIYGPRGFFQFQCVIPPQQGPEVVSELLQQIAALRQGSFLAVLKVFGDMDSPGLLSFPRPGPTLALDFPNLGEKTMALMKRLEAIAMEGGGALYPAKDACMSPETFQHSYPSWRELEAHRDPRCSSTFWRRVTGQSS